MSDLTPRTWDDVLREAMDDFELWLDCKRRGGSREAAEMLYEQELEARRGK